MPPSDSEAAFFYPPLGANPSPSGEPFKMVQYLKGKTPRKILQEFPKLTNMYGAHFWSRGYFVATSGATTDETIMDYIENQDEDADKRCDNFTVLDIG
jgi:REP element-mobilizing transposase RayT